MSERAQQPVDQRIEPKVRSAGNLPSPPEGGKVRVITCPCGWSRMVARTIPAARRRQIIEQHKNEKHPDKEQS